MKKTTNILAIAAVSAIALSTPAMADLKDALMNTVTTTATKEVEVQAAEVKKEMTKEVVKSAAHSVGVTGSDSMIEKGVDGYDQLKKVQALPEGSVTEMAKDAAMKVTEGKDVTTAVTEAVDAKTTTATTKTSVIESLKDAGSKELSKTMETVKTLEPASGKDVMDKAVETVTAKTTTVVKEEAEKEATTSIWDSVKGLFN